MSRKKKTIVVEVVEEEENLLWMTKFEYSVLCAKVAKQIIDGYIPVTVENRNTNPLCLAEDIITKGECDMYIMRNGNYIHVKNFAIRNY